MTDWHRVLRQDVLPRYGWHDATLTHLSSTNNHVFRAVRGAESAIVRLQVRPIASAELASELAWVSALGEQFCVPTPFRTLDGALFVAGMADGTPYYVALLSVLQGYEHTIDTLTPAIVAHIGAFVAGLHAVAFAPAPNFTRPRLNADTLFATDGVYPLKDEETLFSPAQRDIMHATAQRVRGVMVAFDAHSHLFGMIHSDLLLPNMLFAEDGRVCALDFEYCGWGYYLYDLTPLLWQLKPTKDYNTYLATYWGAYVARHPHVAPFYDILETLIAGRHLASIRWLVGQQGGVTALAVHRLGELVQFLQTGVLVRTPLLA